METMAVWRMKLVPQSTREDGMETARTLPRIFAKTQPNIEIQGWFLLFLHQSGGTEPLELERRRFDGS